VDPHSRRTPGGPTATEIGTSIDVNDDLLRHGAHLSGTREIHATREISDHEIWTSTARDAIREMALLQQALRILTPRLSAMGNHIAAEAAYEGGVALQDVAGTSTTMTETDTMIHVIGCQTSGIDSEAGRLPDDQRETYERSEISIEGTAMTGGFLESTTLTLARQALRNLGCEHWTRTVAKVLLTHVIFQVHLQDQRHTHPTMHLHPIGWVRK
jgi:hypothetical protein